MREKTSPPRSERCTQEESGKSTKPPHHGLNLSGGSSGPAVMPASGRDRRVPLGLRPMPPARGL
jgi:hypothetical protein